MRGFNMPCKHRAVRSWIQAEHPLFGSLIETRVHEGKMVTKLHMSDQIITCAILVLGTGEQFFCSAIFGYNTAFYRLHLGRDLRATHSAYAHLNLPWILMGDFNVTLMSNEHSRAKDYRIPSSGTEQGELWRSLEQNKAGTLIQRPLQGKKRLQLDGRSWQGNSRNSINRSLVFAGFKWGTIILSSFIGRHKKGSGLSFSTLLTIARLVWGGGVQQKLVLKLALILSEAAPRGIPVGNLPICYLGMPLTTKSLTAQEYEPLIDKTISRRGDEEKEKENKKKNMI
ncbi:hypothetical protein HID58_048327 [Brassica napus]|uniref:Exo_endo_phos domain-containing protein n=1 Tax=Brassica napus TaxID=3708 RepID=A0ABQ8B1T4_BRANA|nr:hypothetical protein HID58_048327 [Brassica napus]